VKGRCRYWTPICSRTHDFGPAIPGAAPNFDRPEMLTFMQRRDAAEDGPSRSSSTRPLRTAAVEDVFSVSFRASAGTIWRRFICMKKWRSRVTTDGLDRAPHRASWRAMGRTTRRSQPMIGVVSMNGRTDALQHDQRFRLMPLRRDRGGRRHGRGNYHHFVSDGSQHESRGNEVFAFSSEFDCRFNRSRGPRPSLRCI